MKPSLLKMLAIDAYTKSSSGPMVLPQAELHFWIWMRCMLAQESAISNKSWQNACDRSYPTPTPVEIDPELLDSSTRYKLLIGSVVPRLIAFVSSLLPEGVATLAPSSTSMPLATGPWR